MNWGAIAKFVTKNLPVIASIVIAARDLLRPKKKKKDGE